MQAKPIKSVMLIDDESIDRMIYKSVLKKSELVDDIYEFTYAKDALEFLADTSNPPIDVIFLDIRMPQMDGFEFLEAATKALGNNFASMVIMMLTTSLNPKDIERAKSFEVVKDYINKPMEFIHVQQAVEHLEQLRGNS